jgi:hypothetical protein
MRKIIVTIGAALAIGLLAVTFAPSLPASGSPGDRGEGMAHRVGSNWEDDWFEDIMSFVSDWFGDFDSGDELDRAMPTAVVNGINIDKPGHPITGSGSAGGGRDDVSGFSLT